MRWADLGRITLVISVIANFILWFRWQKEGSKLLASHIWQTAERYGMAGLSGHRRMKLEKVKVRRLTDVVIPLPPKHFHKVQELLKLWEQHWPCYDPNDYPDTSLASKDKGNEYYKSHNYNLGYDITLTFFVSCASDARLEEKLLGLYDALPFQCRRCFRRARVHFAGLAGDKDTYWYGTTLMFEQLLFHKVGLRWPHYVLYMEPDMLPIKKYWLSALDATTRDPVPEFWMKGSLFKGQPFLKSISLIPLSLHINGNAIYNLADDRFREFYHGKVYNLSRNDPKSNHAYDLDMFFYLCYAGNYEKAQLLAHRFQYTELIQNYYHTEYSASKLLKHYPNVYLVHGGTMRT